MSLWPYEFLRLWVHAEGKKWRWGNEVWLLAFDERGGCIVIAFRLQAYHLVKVIKPNRTLHRLLNILSCLHCFLSFFRLLVGILPVLLS